MEDPGGAGGACRHIALLYHEPGEYSAAVDDFVKTGAAEHEPVFVAVPKSQLPLISEPTADAVVSMTEMEDIGRNPARIIAALRGFADQHVGRRIRYLGEPLWTGRSAAERRETERHEVLLNRAFAGAHVTMMCPYNAASLPRSALAFARSAHPILMSGGRERRSHGYLAPDSTLARINRPLAEPPDSAQALAYDRDLRPLRALVAAAASQAGLTGERSTDLVIAASEVAANTLRHTGGGGVVRLWRTTAEFLCQVDDGGYIPDPLAGHVRPARGVIGGQGLWLVNQVCDLVEIRTAELGTTIRLHMRLS